MRPCVRYLVANNRHTHLRVLSEAKKESGWKNFPHNLPHRVRYFLYKNRKHNLLLYRPRLMVHSIARTKQQYSIQPTRRNNTTTTQQHRKTRKSNSNEADSPVNSRGKEGSSRNPIGRSQENVREARVPQPFCPSSPYVRHVTNGTRQKAGKLSNNLTLLCVRLLHSNKELVEASTFILSSI